MISNSRVLLWFQLHFSLAAGAAVGARMGLGAGFAVGLLALGLGYASLRAGWAVREKKDALKPVSDGVAVLGIVVFLPLLISADLVLALAGLLFFAQLALNLVLREYRQLYFGLVIAFVLLMAGAAEALSGSYLLVLAAYAVLAGFCCGEIWLDRQAMTQTEGPQPGLVQWTQVAFAVLGLAVLVYVLMPRPPAANLGAREASAATQYSSDSWEAMADSPLDGSDADSADGRYGDTRAPQFSREQGNQYPGFDSEFDIRDGGHGGANGEGNGKVDPNAIVAFMQAPHGAYLKVRTFDTFDGLSWHSSRQGKEFQRLERGRFLIDDNLQGNYRQHIRVVADMPASLPAAAQPVELHLPAKVAAMDAWQQPLLPDLLRAGTRYTVDSRIQWFQGRPLGSGPEPESTDLQLPTDLDPRIPALAREVVAAAANDHDRAVLLEHHLREEYEYSLSSVFDSQGETPLPRFLFEERRGHCEYFASAMAIMLRSLNIPARLVTGYSAADKNPMTGYYEIRAINGHAWVEAWLPEAGWVSFEPTAFYELPRPGHEPLSARQISQYVERQLIVKEALGADQITPGLLLAAIWQWLALMATVALAWLKLVFLSVWPMLAVLGLGLAAALITRDRWIGPYKRWRSHRRIRRYRPLDSQPALHFYLDHLQQMAELEGVDRQPGEPIERWSSRLHNQFGDGLPTQAFLDQVNASFYHQHETSTEAIRAAALALSDSLAKQST